jgi:hypothetical protein
VSVRRQRRLLVGHGHKHREPVKLKVNCLRTESRTLESAR